MELVSFWGGMMLQHKALTGKNPQDFRAQGSKI